MIKIYQINDERDINNIKFFGTWMIKKFNKKFDFSIYDEIWCGETESEDLEAIFEEFNLRHPANFKGHSLSVSDIVQIIGSDEKSNGYYFCDSLGWVKLTNELTIQN